MAATHQRQDPTRRCSRRRSMIRLLVFLAGCCGGGRSLVLTVPAAGDSLGDERDCRGTRVEGRLVFVYALGVHNRINVVRTAVPSLLFAFLLVWFPIAV